MSTAGGRNVNIAKNTFEKDVTINVQQNDYSVLPDPLKKPLYFGLPINIVNVIGRDKEIEDVYDMLKKDKNVAVTGLGGIGKTSLVTYCVKEWVITSRDAFVKHVAFLNCDSLSTFQYSIESLAMKLHININGVPLLEVLKDVIDEMRRENVLFIYDNVDDYEIIRNYLPRDENQNIFSLATSQNTELQEYFTCYKLEMMNNTSAKELVGSKLQKYEQQLDYNIVNDLVTLFRGYPLGLIQACATINYKMLNPRNKTTVNQNIKQYIEKFEENIKKDPPKSTLELYRNSITVAITINFEKIEKEYEEESKSIDIFNQIKQVIALANPDGIESNIFNVLVNDDVDDDDVCEAIRSFTKFDILSAWNTDTYCEYLKIHRTVQLIIKNMINPSHFFVVLCEVINLIGKLYIKRHNSFLCSHINKNIIMICDENEWRQNCRKIFSTPCINNLLKNIVNVLNSNSKDKKCLNYLRILCEELAEIGNLIAYECCIKRDSNIKKIFQDILNQKNLNISNWEQELEDLNLLAVDEKTIPKEYIWTYWIDIHWLSWWGWINKLKSYHQLEFSTDWCGWTIMHVGAVTGNVELLKLFPNEFLESFEDNGVGKDSLPALILAAKYGNHNYLEQLLDFGWSIHVTVRETTALHTAAKYGHLKTVQLLLERGIDINWTDYSSYTALHYATENGHLEIVNELLIQGIRINDATIKGSSALHLAVIGGHGKIVELLLHQGININLIDRRGRTAFHCAVREGCNEIIDLLLDQNISVDLLDKDGNSALHWSTHAGNIRTMKILTDAGLDVDLKNIVQATALLWAASQSSVETVEFLLDRNANVNVSNVYGSALHIAVECNQEQIVEVLLNKNIDFNLFNEEGNNALHVAVLYNRKEIIKILLRHGVDVNSVGSSGQTALHKAAMKSNLDVVQMLIEQGAKIDTRDSDLRTALHCAVSENRTEIVQILLEKEIDLNISDRDGRTALHFATNEEYVSIVKLLLQYNVDVNKTDAKGRNALFMPIKWRYLETIKLLLDSGIDVNSSDNRKVTPLHFASHENNFEVAELLLSRQDINLTPADIYGRIPLHISAEEGGMQITKMYLSKGVDVNTATRSGKTALHWAAKNSHDYLVNFLINAGSKINAADARGETPLHWVLREYVNADTSHCSVQEEYMSTVKLLLKHGAYVNNACHTLINNMTDKNSSERREMVNLLLEYATIDT